MFLNGAASQYKNRKNFINLANHEADFGMPADWHFFATSHRKGPCDGVGGTVKRLAARASLQRPFENQIQTPLQLFEWAKDNIKGVHFAYATSEEILETGKKLAQRFLTSKAIEGTQQLHAFVSMPYCKTKIKAQEYSFASSETTFSVSSISLKELLEWEKIRGYVTCEYDGKWWLAYGLEQCQSTREIKVKFLHPSGPATSFSFPRKDDVLTVPHGAILSAVSPVTATGRTYTLTETEMAEATMCLQ